MLTSKVRVHHAAVFDRDTEIAFELASRHSGDHRIRVGAPSRSLQENRRPTIRVAAKRLDDVVTEIRGPLGVKIDTQGAEPFVIRGGARVVTSADLVALEFWPYSMARWRRCRRCQSDSVRNTFEKGVPHPEMPTIHHAGNPSLRWQEIWGDTLTSIVSTLTTTLTSCCESKLISPPMAGGTGARTTCQYCSLSHCSPTFWRPCQRLGPRINSSCSLDGLAPDRNAGARRAWPRKRAQIVCFETAARRQSPSGCARARGSGGCRGRR